MKAENKAFLDANRHHYDTFIKAQFIKHFDGNTSGTMLRIIQEEFNPGYFQNLWCSSCVADMLVYCYRMYDKWLKENPEPVEEPVEVVPASIAGLTIKSTFPKHNQPKKERRRK